MNIQLYVLEDYSADVAFSLDLYTETTMSIGIFIERVTTKLYTHQVHADIPEIPNTFWK